MKISILTTDPAHPVVPYLKHWKKEINLIGRDVSIVYDKKHLTDGDILFLVSCSQIIGSSERSGYKTSLVLHASNLPIGRGWSPHIWAIESGDNHITVCLLEAGDPVDSGDIWLKTSFELEGHELLPEINEKLFNAEIFLMTKATESYDSIVPTPQPDVADTYMQKRTAENSRLNVNKSLSDQFDLLRVVDNVRYPAFFDHRGNRYLITIEKAAHE